MKHKNPGRRKHFL